jgi:hypothetical protein
LFSSDKTAGIIYSVVLFYTTSMAIRAEKLCKKNEIPVKLMVVPRHLSSDCGICLRFQCHDETAVRKTLSEGQVDTEGIYRI